MRPFGIIGRWSRFVPAAGQPAFDLFALLLRALSGEKRIRAKKMAREKKGGKKCRVRFAPGCTSARRRRAWELEPMARKGID